MSRFVDTLRVMLAPSSAPAADVSAAPSKSVAVVPAKRTYFAGAQLNRLTNDWNSWLRSGDRELLADLRLLRGRARQLERDVSYAKGFLDLTVANVIGAKGIALEAKHETQEGDRFDRVIDLVEDAWIDWCHPENCDVAGRLSHRDQQELYLRTLLRDGEVLARKIPFFSGSEYKFALQFIDPDQIDEYYNRWPRDGVNEIRMGVEIDEWGKAVAYHLWQRHPSELTQRVRIRVDASELIHDFLPWRVNQHRGLTVFSAVLFDLNMLGAYQDAEVVAARVGGSSMGFFTQTGEDGAANLIPGEAGDFVTNNTLDTSVSMEAEPGRMQALPPGWTFQAFNPEHPGGNFGPFVTQMLRSTATGLGIPYHMLANDLAGVNYSSARDGKLTAQDIWRTLQQHTIEHFCRQVYNAWLPMAILSGKLNLPAADLARWQQQVEWMPRGWDWVDPLKDLQATSLQIAMGLMSRSRAAKELGLDFEDILDEQQRDEAMAKERGLILSLDTKLTADASAGGGTGEEPAPSGGEPSSNGTKPQAAQPARHFRLARRTGI